MGNPVTRVPCAEGACPTPIADTPENRCGGSVDGGPQGCGQLFCGDHLFHTCQYGYLCDDDYGNVDKNESETEPNA
jgi:hypothetical protein